MALTQISDAGLKKPASDLQDNEKITIGTGNDLEIFHDGTNTMIDNDTGDLKISSPVLRLRGDQVSIQNEDQTEGYINCFKDGAVELYHNNSKKFETYASGVEVTGHVNITGSNHVYLADSGKLVCGAGNDLQIYHNGSTASVIDAKAGDYLYIYSDNLRLNTKTGAEKYLTGTLNGAVELYHNNSKKFETASDGVKLAADNSVLYLGLGNDLRMWHNGTDSYIKTITGDLYVESTVDDVFIKSADDIFLQPQGGEQGLNINGNAGVELYYDASKKLETIATGVKVHGGNSALLVQGSGEVQMAVGSTDASGAAIYFDGDSNGDWSGSDYSWIRHTTGGDMEYNADNPSGGTSHLFKSADSEKLRINANGQISSRGSSTAFDTTGELDALQLYYETDSGIASIGPYSSGGNTELSFYTNAGGNAATEKLRITSAGNIGINNASPNARIEITDTSVAQIRLGYNSAKYVAIGRNSGNYEFISQENGSALVFGTAESSDGGGAEKMRIDRYGNVGIGTTSPATNNNLHVKDASDRCYVTFESGGNESTQLSLKNPARSWHISNYYDGNALTFTDDSDERLRIDSSGKVGIGTTDPFSKLHINTTHYTVASSGRAANGLHLDGHCGNANEYGGAISFGNGATGASAIASVQLSSDCDVNGLAFFAHGSSTGSDDATEIMRMGADNFRIGGTSLTFDDLADSSGSGNLGMNIDLDDGRTVISVANRTCLHLNRKSSTGTILNFKYNGSQKGRVTMNSSSVTYNTSSDYRLKENEVPISDGITRLKTLKPYRFNFKNDPDVTVDGFFAHEVTPAVPEAISGVKDDNNEMQGMDYGRITPLLTAALQEAITKIETLETKVAALEAG